MLIRSVLRAAHGGTVPLRVRQRCVTLWRETHHCSAVVYREHSHDIDALRMEQLPLPPVKDGSVRIRMLAAPVNPADLNMIQGSYPILCPVPAVGGNEGVGEVLEVGSDVTSLRPGDWVMPIDAGFDSNTDLAQVRVESTCARRGPDLGRHYVAVWDTRSRCKTVLGTWRTGAVCEEDELMSVPKDISVLGAATIFVNPCTAFRMLNDFQTLAPGCTVIQNASNSAVGQAVIQIAAALGLKTINIIRDRPNCAELMDVLQSLGADYVVTEEEVMSSGLHRVFEEVPKPKLGLNCVGGLSGGLVLSNLDYGGTMVTYGGMAKRPLQIPAKSFIFQNVTLKGFWLTQWKRHHRADKARLKAMLDAVCELMRAGQLSTPHCVQIPFQQYTHALRATLQSHRRKHILIM